MGKKSKSLDINLPHLAPIKFAKTILLKEIDKAIVEVEFDKIPSLPMLVEAAAQSSSAIGNEDIDIAYLVSVKNIQLFTPPTQNGFEIEVINEHNFENMRYMSFNVFEKEKIIVDGSFIIALDLKKVS